LEFEVNIEKTKLVVFRKGGILGNKDTWFYNNQVIEVVNSFNYIGVVLPSCESFMKATKKELKHLADFCDKAFTLKDSLLKYVDALLLPSFSVLCFCYFFHNDHCHC
jgi:hypothetical protein